MKFVKLRSLNSANDLKAADETIQDITKIYGNILSITADPFSKGSVLIAEFLEDQEINDHIGELIFLTGKFFENNYRIASISNPENK